MLTWRFAVLLNRLLVGLVGLVIEKTKSVPCVIVKKTFQVTCEVASFQIQKMQLILFCRVPVSSGRQKISIENTTQNLGSCQIVIPGRNVIIGTANRIINNQGKSVTLDFFTNCSDLCQLTVATSRRTMYIS